VPRFVFEAIDHNGIVTSGTLEATSQDSALDQLISNGQTPVSVRAAQSQPALLQNVRALFGFGAFNYISFLRELGTLLKAGLPTERALTTLKSLSSDARMALRVHQILTRVRNGEPLSQAFGVIVSEAPPHIARLLAAGEMSGNLAEVAERVAAGLTRSKLLKTRLISDLTYPLVLMIAVIVVLWVMFHSVLPRLTPMFSQAGVTLPLPTRLLIAAGSFFNHYGWSLLAIIIILVTIFIYALKRPSTRLHFDHLLLTSRLTLGLPRAFEAALFCRNLQTVLDGGLPLERALGVARDGVANRWFRAQMSEVQRAVGEGQRLSQALTLKASVLPPLVAEFSAVGEETGRLSAMMQEAADMLDHIVQTRLNRLTTLVAPLTTLIMGALVAGLMSGIVGGILAINDLAR
jgi:general secretion pathway protein F